MKLFKFFEDLFFPNDSKHYSDGEIVYSIEEKTFLKKSNFLFRNLKKQLKKRSEKISEKILKHILKEIEDNITGAPKSIYSPIKSENEKIFDIDVIFDFSKTKCGGLNTQKFLEDPCKYRDCDLKRILLDRICVSYKNKSETVVKYEFFPKTSIGEKLSVFDFGESERVIPSDDRIGLSEILVLRYCVDKDNIYIMGSGVSFKTYYYAAVSDLKHGECQIDFTDSVEDYDCSICGNGNFLRFLSEDAVKCNHKIFFVLEHNLLDKAYKNVIFEICKKLNDLKLQESN